MERAREEAFNEVYHRRVEIKRYRSTNSEKILSIYQSDKQILFFQY